MCVDFAAELSGRTGAVVHWVPGLALDVGNPTTAGLGDTFVGGFLTAVARRQAR
ncbi:hypothetical protein [Actinoplanes auranticolor]|uniref:PfkB family carbohydrate kinase n=1 Tax=Actinoplanes auranticolor TaxID=47988 RepID=A0A919S7Q2_9ACTN|nr:hypothetical protein [Actinoplanes auranticolor]GIM66540.1 hypothetical protein Aau02nite_23320 [Actinoplanes auranticolor]